MSQPCPIAGFRSPACVTPITYGKFLCHRLFRTSRGFPNSATCFTFLFHFLSHFLVSLLFHSCFTSLFQPSVVSFLVYLPDFLVIQLSRSPLVLLGPNRKGAPLITEPSPAACLLQSLLSP